MSVDDSKRTKQKLRKLLLKYTDVLQKPIMLVINQEALKRGMTVQTSPKYPIPDLSIRAEERFSWFLEWKTKVTENLQYLRSGRSHDFEFLNTCLKDGSLSECFTSNTTCITLKEENLGIWTTIDSILQTAASCNELWIGEGKSLGKRRALSEFLKLLNSCGLFKHRSSLIKDQSNWWLFQSSYDISHLLPTQDGLHSEEDISTVLSQALNLPSENVAGLWVATKKYYFRSISSVNNLLSVSLNLHKILLDVEKSIVSSGELEAAHDEALKETYNHMQ
ncbi:midasin-like [Impatiens glandulifera]|uniref:midasin-like n=1 Tax=Impatiens glandulifera TaxID=253017 RepID=UPI001FB07A95|nr:midasin-like [Impatiens glandulifera]